MKPIFWVILPILWVSPLMAEKRYVVDGKLFRLTNSMPISIDEIINERRNNEVPVETTLERIEKILAEVVQIRRMLEDTLD